MLALPLVQVGVIGKLVTLSEREAETLRDVAAADASVKAPCAMIVAPKEKK